MKQAQRSECLVKPRGEGARGSGQAALAGQGSREGRCRTGCQRPGPRCPHQPPRCAGALGVRAAPSWDQTEAEAGG